MNWILLYYAQPFSVIALHWLTNQVSSIFRFYKAFFFCTGSRKKNIEMIVRYTQIVYKYQHIYEIGDNSCMCVWWYDTHTLSVQYLSLKYLLFSTHMNTQSCLRECCGCFFFIKSQNFHQVEKRFHWVHHTNWSYFIAVSNTDIDKDNSRQERIETYPIPI